MTYQCSTADVKSIVLPKTRSFGLLLSWSGFTKENSPLVLTRGMEEDGRRVTGFDTDYRWDSTSSSISLFIQSTGGTV